MHSRNLKLLKILFMIFSTLLISAGSESEQQPDRFTGANLLSKYMKYREPFKDRSREEVSEIIDTKNEYIEAAKKVPLTYYRRNPNNKNRWSDALVKLDKLYKFNEIRQSTIEELNQKFQVARMLMNRIDINDKNTPKEDYISGLLTLINEIPRDGENYRLYAYPILQFDDPEDVKNYEKAKAKYRNACQYFEKSWDSDHIPIKQACKQLKKDSENQKNLEYEEESFIYTLFKKYYSMQIPLGQYLKFKTISFNLENSHPKILKISNFLDDKNKLLKDNKAIVNICFNIVSYINNFINNFMFLPSDKLIKQKEDITKEFNLFIKVRQKVQAYEKNLSDIGIALDNFKIVFDLFKKKVKSIISEEVNKYTESRLSEAIKCLSRFENKLNQAIKFFEIILKKRKILGIEDVSASSSG